MSDTISSPDCLSLRRDGPRGPFKSGLALCFSLKPFVWPPFAMIVALSPPLPLHVVETLFVDVSGFL